AGTGGAALDPRDLISDFEDAAAATVVMAGNPPRNGFWYVYNDDNPGRSDATCVQAPRSRPETDALGLPPDPYIGVAPPNLHAGAIGSRALRGMWSGCSVWGAGIGTDLNMPIIPDGGTYSGPRVVYDVTAYAGVTFWAMAAPNSDTRLRI